MARIKTYTIDTLISDNDIVIGSDKDNFDQTKNYEISALRQYMLGGLNPEIGGNLKITTIVDNDSEETTPEGYFNNSVTPITVLHYEIVFLILNGRTFIFRKNNDVYGVDETQVISSDFTEIDITSVINANLQDLDSVLDTGNESSDKNAKINSLYLWDNHNNDDYGVIVNGDKDRINFSKSNEDPIGNIDIGKIQIKTIGVGTFELSFPSIPSAEEAIFQNTSGTVAYISDIPTDYIINVFSNSDEISATSNDGEIELTYNEQKNVVLVNTLLIDSLTDTTYYSNGGAFSFDETTEPINSLKLIFEEDIEIDTLDNFGYYAFHYKNGDNILQTIPVTGHSIVYNELTVPLPLVDYWSADMSHFSIHLSVGCVTSLSNGRSFNGLTPSSITNYYNTQVTPGISDPSVVLTRVTETLVEGVYEYEYSITGDASEVFLQYRESSSDFWSLAGAGETSATNITESNDLGGSLPPSAQFRVKVTFVGFGDMYSNIE